MVTDDLLAGPISLYTLTTSSSLYRRLDHWQEDWANILVCRKVSSAVAKEPMRLLLVHCSESGLVDEE